ncbi:F-box/kelch-repeat protein At3g06240-like [Vicia villosa]|uniref:F-box/kelch-repeat protein At3g06240-like n=1 Tax=Vicia villosa TaxID=3911 RepID=UPI00273B7D9C|nr:F-box/kelch-repeat protein At3g06240-like [Vicia villosa]
MRWFMNFMLLAQKTIRKRRRRERSMEKKKRKTKTTKTKTTATTPPKSYVPEEMITEILLSLPVKSLIRFKCVSKPWFSLISDPNFAESHFQLTAHTRKIEFISTELQKTTSIDFEEQLVLRNASVKQFNFLHPQPDSLIQIISSCRGFIFFKYSSSFCIFNPCTQVHKQIPLAPGEFETNLELRDLYYLYGFGYDRLRDDYLVVSLSCILAEEDFSRLEYFSFKDNKWKEIEDTYFLYTKDKIEPRVGSLYNDAIHWIAIHSDSLTEVIIAFDLTERKLFEMPYPNGLGHKSDYCELWVFGEFLSLWAKDCENNTIEIWVMKEYNMHWSWIKAIVLRMNIRFFNEFFPLCSTKNGDIIGTDAENMLVRYNNKGELIEGSSYRCFADGVVSCGSPSIVYTESLLSLPGDDMQVYEDDSD